MLEEAAAGPACAAEAVCEVVEAILEFLQRNDSADTELEEQPYWNVRPRGEKETKDTPKCAGTSSKCFDIRHFGRFPHVDTY